MRRSFLTILFAAIAIQACNNSTPDPEIYSDSTPKVVVGGKTLLCWEENNWQTGASNDGKFFFTGTDTMSDFFSVSLKTPAEEPGETIVAEKVIWTTKDDYVEKKNLSLKVVQISEESIWFWNAAEKITIVVRKSH